MNGFQEYRVFHLSAQGYPSTAFVWATYAIGAREKFERKYPGREIIAIDPTGRTRWA